MNEQIAALFAKRFIQRRDVKAVQLAFPERVIYTPDRELKNLGSHGPAGFKMPHLMAHLAGSATYGHYLLDADDHARVFVFDIDLKTEGFWVPIEPWTEGMSETDWEAKQVPQAFNPRQDWLNRAHPSRSWLKGQFSMLARKLVNGIQKELGIPCAAAYSGNKGIHVYGFTGPMPAKQVRAAATLVLDVSDEWELERGEHIWRYKSQDPFNGYPNVNLELYPKQDSLDGKDLGNLIRLPLGKNLKNPNDPTFFLDLKTPSSVMAPHKDPMTLLDSGDPYS